MNRIKRVAAVTAVVALCTACASYTAMQPQTSATYMLTLSATTDNLPGNDVHEPGGAPPVPQAAGVAVRFVNAWIDTSGGEARWRSRLAPLCEAGFARTLATAKPDRIGAHAILGPPVIATIDDAGWIRAEVPTDAGILLLTLAPVNGEWLVSQVELRRSLS